LLSKLY
ncbi:hypothetical protein CI238_05266, partial [Colletotrichum incanum]